MDDEQPKARSLFEAMYLSDGENRFNDLIECLSAFFDISEENLFGEYEELIDIVNGQFTLN